MFASTSTYLSKPVRRVIKFSKKTFFKYSYSSLTVYIKKKPNSFVFPNIKIPSFITNIEFAYNSETPNLI